MTEHRHGQSKFRELVGTELSGELADVLLDWIREAHEVAACMNHHRHGPRGPWNNLTSYRSDRYQYLVETAEHLALELPQIDPKTSHEPHLLHVGEKCSIYHFHAPGNSPCGPLLNRSEFQRTMAGPDAAETELVLFTEAQCWLGDRELVLMPWAEDVNHRLAQVWVGQGAHTSDETIEWTWLHPLQDVIDVDGSASGGPPSSPVAPPQRTGSRSGAAASSTRSPTARSVGHHPTAIC